MLKVDCGKNNFVSNKHEEKNVINAQTEFIVCTFIFEVSVQMIQVFQHDMTSSSLHDINY